MGTVLPLFWIYDCSATPQSGCYAASSSEAIVNAADSVGSTFFIFLQPLLVIISVLVVGPYFLRWILRMIKKL